MCTLTYYPDSDRVIITSNRDEHPSRSHCQIVREKMPNSIELAYPKEPLKGGTWITVDALGQVLILLNGAFEKHDYRPNYGKSRGILLLEMAKCESGRAYLEEAELEQVEPFTIVSYHANSFFEFRWNGSDKFWKDLDRKVPQIWSSATLYTIEQREMRSQWYFESLQNPLINETLLWNFHTQASTDIENGIVMKRPQGPETLSSTQMILDSKGVFFKYVDHCNQVQEEIVWNHE